MSYMLVRRAHLHRAAQFLSDRAGTASILAAISFVALTAMSALAIDVSNFYYQKRRLQSAADLAAVAAASDPGNGRAAALAALASNGFAAGALELLEFGGYAADATVPSKSRFVAGASGGNAVRLVASVTAPALLGRVFAMMAPPAQAATSVETLNGSVRIRAQAVAAPASSASFAIGSRLLQLDGGILNAILGKLLGANLSLSLMDYQALASARVDLFTFANALATRVSLTGATYDSVAQGAYRLPDILGAAATALPSGNAAAGDALRRLSGAVSGAANVSLPALVSFGAYGSRDVGGTAPLTLTVAALDLVTALAQIANGQQQVLVYLPVTVPPLASASLRLAIGSRPVDSSAFATGRPGTAVNTTQTRLLLTVTLTGPLPGTTIDLPIVLDLASGKAQLANIACSSGATTASSVTLAVTPSLVDASIGTLSAADFGNFTVTPAPASAPLLTVAGVVSITGRAHATIANGTASNIVFSASEIVAGTKKTTSTTDLTASLLASLIGDLRLTVSTFGFGFGIPTNLDASVAAVVASAATPLDGVINAVLTALGVGAGQADTWVSGARCGQAVLVN